MGLWHHFGVFFNLKEGVFYFFIFRRFMKHQNLKFSQKAQKIAKIKNLNFKCPKIGLKRAKKGPKWKKIKNPRNKFCLYPKTPGSCINSRKLEQMAKNSIF